jgi:hypothetical protein
VVKIGSVERVDLVIRNNATFKLTLTHTDPVTGAVVPLTGWSVQMQFRDQPGGRLLDTFTSGTGFTIDEPNGRVDFKVQPVTIQSWTFKSGWYDVKMTEPGGDQDVWLEGKFEVGIGVTV